MVWDFPPERAGRAPQASRHSNGAEAAWREVVGPGGGLVVRSAPVADGCLGPLSDADAETIRGAVEHAPTTDAKPTAPARRSS
jgi:hypothetical protein